ncbi:MAG: hypothetical protein ACOZF0_05175 [Thermodesulfobacteriota bacterium]
MMLDALPPDIEKKIEKIGDNLVRMAEVRERQANAEAVLMELVARLFKSPDKNVKKSGE